MSGNVPAQTPYHELVKNLLKQSILKKWPEIAPLDNTSGLSQVTENSSDSQNNLFDGHDEEQIKLMDELCVVLDYDDQALGAATKKTCHLMKNINAGLLHRAFSVFLFNPEGKLLLQQRADEKITFPNMWTNTCCSHPLCVPSELGIAGQENDFSTLLQNSVRGAKVAAQRKLGHELGMSEADCPIDDFHFLTRIHYKSASGSETSKWGEHEIDYILIIKTKDEVKLNPNLNEVRDYKYVNEKELREMLEDDQLIFTPWFKLICETFLWKWWKTLDNLSGFEDDKIHRLL